MNRLLNGAVTVRHQAFVDEVEDAKRLSPIIKIDDEYITKAKPEVLMEKMYAKIKPERDKLKNSK